MDVISLFSVGLDIFNTIKQMRGASEDLADILARLRLEEAKIRYIQKKYESGAIDRDAEEIMVLAQNHVNERLSNIQSTVKKYHISPKDSVKVLPDKTVLPIKLDVLLHRRYEGESFSSGPKSMLKWIAGDKESLEEELHKLQNVIATIWKLCTTTSERVREDYISTSEMISTHDTSLLNTLTVLPIQRYPGIAKAAEVKQLLSQYMSNKSHSKSDLSTAQLKFYIPLRLMGWVGSDLREAMTQPWSIGSYDLSDVGISETPTLVEWRGPFMQPKAPANIKNRLDALCEFLGAMHTVDDRHSNKYIRQTHFGMLKCLGWTHSSDDFDNIGLVFERPNSSGLRPESLRTKILNARAQRKLPPPLGDRFDLAFGVCSAVANIISVGWMHRAIRSDNLLIFDPHQIKQVYLVGFTYARPGLDDEHCEFWELSNLPNQRGIALYRPGDSGEAAGAEDGAVVSGDEADETRSLEEFSDDVSRSPVSACHDLYGLGIILLELGLWNTIENMKNRRKELTVQEFQSYGLNGLLDQLSSRCGEIYRDVVERCLHQSNWQPEDLAKNLGDLLGSLEQCRA